MADKPLVNRVAKSGLITINLEDYFPQSEVVEFDLKPFLFRELLLREKDFRAAMKEIDWSEYAGKQLAFIQNMGHGPGGGRDSGAASFGFFPFTSLANFTAPSTS